MNYFDFLTRVIDDGIEAAKIDYRRDCSYKCEGAVAGFEACRGLSPLQIGALLERARRASHRARESDIKRYWRLSHFENECAWVANVVSAAFMNSGVGQIVPPTARGVLKAAEILGVRSVP